MARKKKTDRPMYAGFPIRPGVMNAAQRAALEAEARASVSLDGCTQSCSACVQKVEHVCGQRPMTVAERELVEAALRHDMLAVMDAEKKVYAERKEAAK